MPYRTKRSERVFCGHCRLYRDDPAHEEYGCAWSQDAAATVKQENWGDIASNAETSLPAQHAAPSIDLDPGWVRADLWMEAHQSRQAANYYAAA